MCLTIRDLTKYKADSPIYVWKVLRKVKDWYEAPIYRFTYTLGITYKSYLNLNIAKGVSYAQVTEGYHTVGYNVNYIFNPYSKNFIVYGTMCNNLNIALNDCDDLVIGLCIIPEGSYYYTDGYFFTSDTLKVLRVIDIQQFVNYLRKR